MLGKYKKVIVFAFVPLLAISLPISFAFKRSRVEKSDPVVFPTSFDNDFFSNFDEWFNDNVPFRDAFIEFYKNSELTIEDAWFKFLLMISGDSDFNYPSSGSIEEITDPFLDKGQPYFAPRYDGYVIYGRDDWLFYSGDGALENYKGSDIYTDYEMNKHMEKFIAVNDICSDRNIDVTFNIFPNKEQVYADKMPSIRVTNRAKKLQRLEHYFSKNSNLSFSYPIDEIIDSRSLGDVYLKEDTHWNPLGAMQGYSDILKGLNRNAPTYTYKETTVQGGDLASMLSSSGSIYTSYNVTYKEDVTYMVIADGDRRYIETKSSLTDGSRCVLIGDSFRNALVPYVAKDYENLTCIHFDYLDSEYAQKEIAKLKAGDTLIVSSVERLYPALVKSLDFLKSHLEK